MQIFPDLSPKLGIVAEHGNVFINFEWKYFEKGLEKSIIIVKHFWVKKDPACTVKLDYNELGYNGKQF